MKICDMTTGSPARHIITFAVPLLGGALMLQLLNITDIMIVGRCINQDALAAVGAAGTIMFGVLGFIWGMTAGMNIVLARYFGAKDDPKLRQAYTHCIMACVAISLLLSPLAYWLTPLLLRLIRIPPELMDYATTYLGIIFIGLCATAFSNFSGTVCLALGDSRTYLLFLSISVVLNIFLDLLFIHCFGWGVAGAAWATVLAQMATAAGGLIHVYRKAPMLRNIQREEWRFNSVMARHILHQSLPMSVQLSIVSIGMIFLQIAVNDLGSTAIAAMTIAVKLGTLLIMPLSLLSQAFSTYCSQNFGAKLYGRISQGIYSTLAMQWTWCLLAGLTMFFFSDSLAKLFTKEQNPETIQLVVKYYRIEVWFYPAVGALFTFRNCLQSMGRPMIPLYSAIGEMLARVFCVLFITTPLGYTGVCLVSPFAWIVGALIMAPFVVTSIRKYLMQKPIEATPANY